LQRGGLGAESGWRRTEVQPLLQQKWGQCKGSAATPHPTRPTHQAHFGDALLCQYALAVKQKPAGGGWRVEDGGGRGRGDGGWVRG